MEETKRLFLPIRFGIFEVDLPAGELRRQGYKVKLQEQPFQLLTMLLEHPGDVVTREELQNQLWPADTFVDFERGLNRAINKLREALGDDADSPRFIETLPRRGVSLRRAGRNGGFARS
jgi:DNA-binding winged helix-turn-helix (wHTH) protein